MLDFRVIFYMGEKQCSRRSKTRTHKTTAAQPACTRDFSQSHFPRCTKFIFFLLKKSFAHTPPSRVVFNSFTDKNNTAAAKLASEFCNSAWKEKSCLCRQYILLMRHKLFAMFELERANGSSDSHCNASHCSCTDSRHFFAIFSRSRSHFFFSAYTHMTWSTAALDSVRTH